MNTLRTLLAPGLLPALLGFLLAAAPVNAEATLKTNPTGYVFEPFSGFLPDIGWVVGLKTISEMTVTFDGFESEDRLHPGDIVQTIAVYRPHSRQKVSRAEIVPDDLLSALDAAALDHGIFVRFVRQSSDGWEEMRREFTSVGTRKERRRAEPLAARNAVYVEAEEERKRQWEEEQQRLAALEIGQRRATGQCIETVYVNVMYDYANDRGCQPAPLKADICDKILYLESWLSCGIFEDRRFFGTYRYKYGSAP